MKEDSSLNKKWERVRRFKGNVALEGYVVIPNIEIRENKEK